ncbi:MAG TPA: dienelactone hydrolase family protein [Euzebyales bacterium]|nr:dienelactone hydrolase family protein [Euzebyales bacterium]
MGAIIRLDERHARAYVAEPDGPVRGCVVVVHDAYGLLPHVRFLCDELAAAGFVAMAPDLFAGSVARSQAQASRLLEELTAVRVGRVLDAALRAFDALGHGDCPHGAVGFSIGSEFAFGLLAAGHLRALVAYDGMPTVEDREAIAAPLLLHWAGTDRWDDDCAPDRLVSDLLARGVDVETHTYEGTVHGFANADIDAFDLAAAEQAWNRTIRFLTDHLSDG